MLIFRISHLAVFIVIISILALPFSLSADAVVPGVNIVDDPGFENTPSKWPLPADSGSSKWRIVTDSPHSGSKCLQLENPDDSTYRSYPLYPLTVHTGCKYKVSAWIKSTDVQDVGSGASIALQWYDKTNKWIAGTYTTAVKGTNGWTQVVAITPFIPKNAAIIKVSPYVRKGSTGTAYFDDIRVEVIDDISFRALIRYPNHKSTFPPSSTRNLLVGIDMMDNPLHPYANMSLVASIIRFDDKVIGEVKHWKPTADGLRTIGFDIISRLPGEYRVNIKLFDKNLVDPIKREVLTFRISTPDTALPMVYIDEYNRCVVNGELFFPIGCYVHNANPTVRAEQLPLMSSAGFNCVLDYGILKIQPLDNINIFLNDLANNNLKAIFSLKDCYTGSTYAINEYGSWTTSFDVVKGIVDTFKDHSSILAWYINDELLEPYLADIATRYDYIKANDYNHPVFQVMSTADDTYSVIKSTDIIGVDDYPLLVMARQGLTTPDLATTISESKNTARAAMNSRGIWMVPECSSQKAFSANSRPPTYTEMLCEAYQGLIGGARGLIFYNWTDLKLDGDSQISVMTDVITHLKSLKAIVLGIDAPWQKQVKTNNPAVHLLTRTIDGSLWILAVNPTQSTQSVSFTIPAAVGTITKVEVGLAGNVTRTINVNAGVFSDNIEMTGTCVYHLIP